MSNVHVHLHVSDLEASRAFYGRFLGGRPVKVKPGYVKLLPAVAPWYLALSATPAGRGGTVIHLGLQVDTKEQIRVLLDRAQAAGLWDVYHRNYDLEEQEAPAQPTTCCTPLSRISLGKRT
jgi:catechol 2,3-dioxygenase-like lactoylglutathione lyase family enzyme